MKIYSPNEIEAIFKNLKAKVESGMNLSSACSACGYPISIFNSPKMVEHKATLKAIIASRNKVKPVKTNQYVVPKKSPYRKEYRPIIRENNYLI